MQNHILLVDHLMVQRGLTFGIFLLADLLGQGSGEVLTDDLIAMFVTLVVLVDCKADKLVL